MNFIIIALGCLPFIIQRRRLTKKDRSAVVIFIFTVLVYIFTGFIHGCTIMGLLARLLTTLTICVFFAKPDFIKKVFSSFFTLYSIVLSVSIVSYVLFLMGILPVLGEIYSPLEEERVYYHYPFLIVEQHALEMFRFAGPFDEAGVVGTISAITLCVNRFRLRDLRSIPVLIGGVLSFSMFFYLLSVIYLVYYYLIIRKKPIAVILLCLLVSLIYVKTKDDALISERVWDRIEWNSSNRQFEGDSRTSIEARRYYSEKKGSLEWFFGLDDPTYFNNISKGSSTYINIIMWHGALFFVLYTLTILLFVFNKVSSVSNKVVVFLIFIANTYQRPDIFGLVVLFLYASLATTYTLDYVKSTELKKKSDNPIVFESSNS